MIYDEEREGSASVAIFYAATLRYTNCLPRRSLSRGTPMYADLEALEARFQTVVRKWDEAESHDEKVQLARAAKEIAWEYRQRVIDYKKRAKTTAP